MPGVAGYKMKKVNDRTRNPGKVKSGKITADAYGPQAPLGTVSMAPKGKRKKGY